MISDANAKRFVVWLMAVTVSRSTRTYETSDFALAGVSGRLLNEDAWYTPSTWLYSPTEILSIVDMKTWRQLFGSLMYLVTFASVAIFSGFSSMKSAATKYPLLSITRDITATSSGLPTISVVNVPGKRGLS